MVFGDRRLWPFVARPWAIGAVLYLVLLIVAGWAFFGAGDAAARAIGGDNAAAIAVGRGVGLSIFVALAFFLSSLAFLTIASLASAFLWEGLSAEVERRLGIEPPMHRHRWTTLALDGAIRFTLMATIAVASVVAGWFCCGVSGVVAAGVLGLMDFTSPAYLRRNQPVWEQAFAVWGLRGWPGFALGCGLIALVPFLNLLLLPGLVAGGTMLRAQQFRRV